MPSLLAICSIFERLSMCRQEEAENPTTTNLASPVSFLATEMLSPPFDETLSLEYHITQKTRRYDGGFCLCIARGTYV